MNVKVATPSAETVIKVDAKKAISSTHTDELVIALCGPMGAPLHKVSEEIRQIVREKFGYNHCEVIMLSSFINEHLKKNVNYNINTVGAKRTEAFIECGNKLRKDHKASVLAELAVHRISNYRVKNNAQDLGPDGVRFNPARVCHIIDSIKNQEEFELLKSVYRESIYFVGVSCSLENRKANLTDKGFSSEDIAKLMDRDSGEEIDYGQTVSDTFPQSDFFLRGDLPLNILTSKIERFLKLVLDCAIITPTREETAMYSAASAAGNSACLSRQVGAAVTDKNGELLAVGWNDVPKAGGDLYISSSGEEILDNRCWNFLSGNCHNDLQKNELAEHILETLKEFIPETDKLRALKLISKDKKLRGLIEFSRSIHAEMHAILTALRHSSSEVKGGQLYVTTYPCHSCARHIVASGIMTVYFLEPYKKSLAVRLHHDSITENETDSKKVRLIPYEGVAPTRFLSLFKMKPNSRKADGKFIRHDFKMSTLKLEKSLEALPALEGLVVASLRSKGLLDES